MTQYVITKDGEVIAYTIDPLRWLHQHTPNSADWAMRHGGYGYREVDHYEIQPADVGRATIEAFGRRWRVADFMGRILEGDVGKRVYLRAGVLYVESDRQRADRLARDG